MSFVGNEPSAATKFFNDAVTAFDAGLADDARDYLELVEYALERDPFKTGFDTDAYQAFCRKLGYDSPYYGWRFSQPQPA